MSLHMLVVGASGVGKNSILDEARKQLDFVKRVSCTTRAPRGGEVNGVNYHFLSHSEFQQKVDQDLFAEHAPYGRNRYGTLAADLETHLRSGKRLIYDIEIQGARQIKQKFPDAFVTFVIPPTMDHLKKRILADPKRSHTPEELEERLSIGRQEVRAAYALADYVMINDKLPETVAHFIGFVHHIESMVLSGNGWNFNARNRHMLDQCLAASS